MTGRSLALLATGLVLSITQPTATSAQAGGGGFVAGSRDLFVLDMAAVPVGEFPKGVKLLKGNVTTVEKDGGRMLRAADPAEIYIPFSEFTPGDFTVEIDLIPKPYGLNPADLRIEGTMSSNRGPASMQLEWSSQHIMVVGGGEMFQRDPPEDLKVATDATLTEIRASFDQGTFKLYVNGQRLVNLPGRAFARARGIRIDLGGQDDDKAAVYVSKLRIATNSPKPQ